MALDQCEDDVRLDAQNRVVQTIEPDGSTNGVVFDPTGKQLSTTDKLGRTTSYTYDFARAAGADHLSRHSTETFAYDAAGNRTNSVIALTGRRPTFSTRSTG